jgi:hypothetical protein
MMMATFPPERRLSQDDFSFEEALDTGNTALIYELMKDCWGPPPPLAPHETPPYESAILKHRQNLALQATGREAETAIPADNRRSWAEIQAQLASDVVFWFLSCATTFDPRKIRGQVMPFILYPFQMQAVRRLATAIEEGDDLLVEKSRDMGASWLVALTYAWAWQYRAGSHFLLGSRRMDSVDQLGNLSSLFEKIRFNLKYLPPWAEPPGFVWRLHSHHARLLNPANSNTIVGEACTEHFARGGRYTSILMDEFAFWPKDEAAFAAAGQASPSRIIVSTPNGMHNHFAYLRHQSPVGVLRLHWQEHPLKTPAWYEAQKRRMSVEEVARELDINYQGSVRDRVFDEFGPQHVLASMAVQPSKRLIRVWDFGYHCPACLFLQEDEAGRLLVHHELVGNREVLHAFAKRVLATTTQLFGEVAGVEDYCDAAGLQHSGLSEHTSVEVLRRLGVNPTPVPCPIVSGLEKIRHLLVETRNLQGLDGLEELPGNEASKANSTPALLVHGAGCPKLVEAFEGAYRYRRGAKEAGDQCLPLEEHPYEDVMDCLRYAVWAKGYLAGDEDWQSLQKKRQLQRWRAKRHKPYRPY